MPPFAFATLLTSDAYLPGALALAAALHHVHGHAPHPPYDTVCLVAPQAVDVAAIRLLRAAFDVVVGVELIVQPDTAALALLRRPDLHTVLTKLHVFRLTQYTKILFLDADVLPLRPLAHLFDLDVDFAAVPDVGWPDIFNSGVFLFAPAPTHFDDLRALLASRGSWDGGDQGLLNEWRQNNWHRLSFTYNTTPTAAYTYAPAYERFGAQIAALHFIGPNKPWHALPFREPGSADPDRHTQSAVYDYPSLVDRWFAVYDKYYRTKPPPEAAPDVFQRYESVWDRTDAPQLSAASGSALSLDELKQLAIEGLARTHTPTPDLMARPLDGGEGAYTSMPLDGRVDLMLRPSTPSKELEEEEEEEEGQKVDYDRHEDSQDAPPSEPSTPQSSHRPEVLHETPIRWGTLPTPGVDEIPGAPHTRPLSLPDTPTPMPLQTQSHTNVPTHIDVHTSSLSQPSPHTPSQERPRSPPLLLWDAAREPPPKTPPAAGGFKFPSDDYFTNVWDRGKGRQYDAPPQSSASATSPPAVGGFNDSSDTYFANTWDRGTSRQHDTPSQSSARARSPSASRSVDSEAPSIHSSTSLSTIPSSELDTPPPTIHTSRHTHTSTHVPATHHTDAFFHPPPAQDIPEVLLREGHYRNVTGPGGGVETPTPDRRKVKRVFPWEERPRQFPGRVFPDTDETPPGVVYVRSTPPPPVPVTPERAGNRLGLGVGAGAPVPSPLHGFSPSFAFTNAWDTVPSIQKYASRLVRPSPMSQVITAQSSPKQFAPAVDVAGGMGTGGRRGGGDANRSRDEKAEASSQDGDVEDEEDSDSDSDMRERETGREKEKEKDRDVQLRRSRSASASSTGPSIGVRGKKSKHRSVGVQTVPKSLQSRGVQVSIVGTGTQTQEPLVRAPPSNVQSPPTVHSPPNIYSPPHLRSPSSVYSPPHARSPSTVHSPPHARSPSRVHSPTHAHHYPHSQATPPRRQWPFASGPDLPPPIAVEGIPSPGANLGSPSALNSARMLPAALPGFGELPSGMMSPREFRPAQGSPSPTSPPLRDRTGGPKVGGQVAVPSQIHGQGTRQVRALPVGSPPSLSNRPSTDTSASQSSPGLVSPPEGVALSTPVGRGGMGMGKGRGTSAGIGMGPVESRKAARVWDPARGVDLFKRGSEEVLARFLRMGSWEGQGSSPEAGSGSGAGVLH